MKKLVFIGIDISKLTLDVSIKANKQESFVIDNNAKSITKFFKEHLKDNQPEFHVCIENTGRYSWELMRLLPEMNCVFYVVNPLHMKKSMGLTRGKSDKIDAERIAKFIEKNHTDTEPFITRRKEIVQLQILLSERNSKVKQRSKISVQSKEHKILNDKKLQRELISLNNQLTNLLNKQIAILEKQIKLLIKNDDKMAETTKLLKTMPGVGDIICWNLLIKTNEFKSIREPRKLACYAGVAPFSNTSGTSIFGKNRVSVYADRSLKKLLHLGAMSAIRNENDFQIYYLRKVEEGKNKMSVLNAVRNKIVHTAFALIKNQKPFVNRLVLS